MTDPALALTVLAGQPTAEELAAVVVVLAARARPSPARAGAAGPEQDAQWAARSRLVRGPVATGPGAWRASALPR